MPVTPIEETVEINCYASGLFFFRNPSVSEEDQFFCPPGALADDVPQTHWKSPASKFPEGHIIKFGFKNDKAAAEKFFEFLLGAYRSVQPDTSRSEKGLEGLEFSPDPLDEAVFSLVAPDSESSLVVGELLCDVVIHNAYWDGSDFVMLKLFADKEVEI